MPDSVMNRSWLISLLCAVIAQKAQSAMNYIREDFFWNCAYFVDVRSFALLKQGERNYLIADVTKSKSTKGLKVPALGRYQVGAKSMDAPYLESAEKIKMYETYFSIEQSKLYKAILQQLHKARFSGVKVGKTLTEKLLEIEQRTLSFGICYIIYLHHVYQCTLEAQMTEINELAKSSFLSIFEVKSSYYQWMGQPDLDQIYYLELYAPDNFVEMSFDNSYGCSKLDNVRYYICLGY